MKNFLLLSFTILTVTASAQDVTFTTEQYKLKNGLNVTLIEYGALPVTAIDLYVNTGKKNETPGQQAISGMTANGIAMGNAKYTQLQQDDLLYEMGSNISPAVNDNFTKISTQFTNANIQKGLELFSAAVLQPAFPEKEMIQYLQSVASYNTPAKMDIAQLAGIYADYFVFGPANPLGRTIYPAQLAKITAAQVKEFHAFNYTPGNAHIVVSGKFDKQQIKQLIELNFGSWTAAMGEMNSAVYDIPKIKAKEVAFVNKNNATQVALNWRKNAPAADSKDVIPFGIAAFILNKKMFAQIREKEGLTYGIGLGFNPSDNNNVYSISAQTRPEETYNMVQSFDRVLNDFFEKGITQKELNTAKTSMKGDYLGMESPQQVMGFLNPFLYKDLEKRKQYLQAVEAVDLETINKIIKKYYTPDAYKLVIVGNEKMIADKIAQINSVKKLSPANIEVDN